MIRNRYTSNAQVHTLLFKLIRFELCQNTSLIFQLVCKKFMKSGASETHSKHSLLEGTFITQMNDPFSLRWESQAKSR